MAVTIKLTEFIIYGAGGFGREVAWLIERGCATVGGGVVAFADDSPSDYLVRNLPVITLDEAVERFPSARVVLSAGSGQARQKMAERIKGKSCTVIDPKAEYDDCTAHFGTGCVICAGTIITVDVTLGRHVHVNLDCTIGHDAILEDFVTLAPGVHISGNVHVRQGAYIGTGASIINGNSEKPLVIGEWSVVGAQACVTKDVEPKTLYAGVPAILKKNYA